MKRRSKENKTKPMLSVRIDPDLMLQVHDFKQKTDLSYGQIVTRALRKALPLLEKVEAELKAA